MCPAQPASQCDEQVFRSVGYAAAGRIRLDPSLFCWCSDVAAPRCGLVASNCGRSFVHETIKRLLADSPTCRLLSSIGRASVGGLLVRSGARSSHLCLIGFGRNSKNLESRRRADAAGGWRMSAALPDDTARAVWRTFLLCAAGLNFLAGLAVIGYAPNKIR